MYELLREFIKPELLILIPVMYLIGIFLKKSYVADKYIPLILGCISVVLCLLYVLAMSSMATVDDVLFAIFSGITQGVLCAGASVYFNQVVKQSGKNE